MRTVNFFRISFLLLITCGVSNSQEVGVHVAKYWTNNYEFQNPAGYGITFYQQIWDLGLKIDYTYAENRRNYYGILNSGFFGPGTVSSSENISSLSSLKSFDLTAIIPKIISAAGFYLNIGAGISQDRYSVSRRGIETNKSANLSGSIHYGYLFSFSISREKIFYLPLNLAVSFTKKYSENSMNVTDTDAPFQSKMEIQKIQLSVSYIL